MHARLQSSAAPAGHRQQHTAVVQQARPMRTRLSCNASIVSRGNLPDEFKEHNGFKLQFVVFSRLTPDHSTATLQPHLPEHEAWLKGLGDKLAFHGPFLNAEASYYGSEMYAVLADSAADARALVEQDPLHSKGLRKFELMSWVQQTQW